MTEPGGKKRWWHETRPERVEPASALTFGATAGMDFVEMRDRHLKLEAFMKSPAYEALSEVDRTLLSEQEVALHSYVSALAAWLRGHP